MPSDWYGHWRARGKPRRQQRYGGELDGAISDFHPERERCILPGSSGPIRNPCGPLEGRTAATRIRFNAGKPLPE